MNHILENLNDEQLQAVTTDDRHVLILAGAGSGKTKAITAHIIYLLEENKSRDFINFSDIISIILTILKKIE